MTNDNPPPPRIIPRSEHIISRNNIDREALKVLYRLRDEGFTAYLVGGGVRDLLLGKTPKDFDISTDARPGQLRQIFRNSRIIGKRFRLVQIYFHNNKIVEVSTFRKQHEFDIGEEEQVLAADNTFGTPVEDAFRRDLTINALFYSIEDFSVIDYTGGMEDLQAGLIRIIGDPVRRITQDPVRMLRALRHAARINFVIEDATWTAIVAQREMLRHCPVSRIRDEVFKDLHGGASQKWTELAIASGLFFVFFPFYEAVLSHPEQAHETKAEIFSLLKIIDRFARESLPCPDSLIMALLLIPWASQSCDLMKKRKGGEFYSFSRHLRTRLDDILGNLNMKKADKESITSLLCQLPVLDFHSGEKELPKKLQRKSYFVEAMQFYKLYQESKGGEPLDVVHFEPPPAPSPKRTRHRGERSPALSNSAKGGIFGFKR